MRIPTSAAALAVGGSFALAGLVAPAAHAADPAQECRSLGVANLYGEFVEGDDHHVPDAEGAVAVGGDAYFAGDDAKNPRSFSVGQELTPGQVAALPGGNALVVAGNLNGHNTQVMKGNGVYGGKLTGVLEAHQGKVGPGASPIDFKAEFAKLRAASAALAAAPRTAGTSVQADTGKVTLTGVDPRLNSFTVDAATLQLAKDVYLKVPAGSVTVVNVTGGSYDMAAAGTTGFHLWDAGTSAFVLDDKLQSAAGGGIRARLLWNFPTATKVVKNSAAAWAGTVLAPNAAFELGSGGPVNGSVIVASLAGSGGAETHHYPFTGCLPAVVPTPSTPATVPPVVPSGSPSATTTPSTPATPGGSATPGASTSPSATSSAPAGGKPNASASVSPSASAAVPAASASASASPSATATAGGNLAHTGSGPVLPLAIGGAVVLAAGGGIVVAARRRTARKA
ncbi:choice-of-anchor A family protein [Kitasatospora sp. NPDC097643]|uniref:choice-of-anchor A family protein n=1 Tax=Kitasatospora sp. NPDC097643 TaxID=3157230 RepID=UPI00332F2955